MMAAASVKSLELSRSVKENHGKPILKIATAIFNSSFSNLIATLSSQQVQLINLHKSTNHFTYSFHP